MKGSLHVNEAPSPTPATASTIPAGAAAPTVAPADAPCASPKKNDDSTSASRSHRARSPVRDGDVQHHQQRSCGAQLRRREHGPERRQGLDRREDPARRREEHPGRHLHANRHVPVPVRPALRRLRHGRLDRGCVGCGRLGRNRGDNVAAWSRVIRVLESTRRRAYRRESWTNLLRSFPSLKRRTTTKSLGPSFSSSFSRESVLPGTAFIPSDTRFRRTRTSSTASLRTTSCCSQPGLSCCRRPLFSPSQARVVYRYLVLEAWQRPGIGCRASARSKPRQWRI